MGTKHLICAVKDGSYRIAQYGQFDGNPEGQGLEILSFLNGPLVSKLKEKLSNCSWITDAEYNELWRNLDVKAMDEFVSFETDKLFCSLHPELDCKTSAKILNIVAESSGEIKLLNRLDFAEDSLFCEWAYVIDFDKNTFEVYRGCNNDPLDRSERFYDEKTERNISENTYYSVKHLATFDLAALPSECEFLEVCEPEDIDQDDDFGMFGIKM